MITQTPKTEPQKKRTLTIISAPPGPEEVEKIHPHIRMIVCGHIDIVTQHYDRHDGVVHHTYIDALKRVSQWLEEPRSME